MAGNMNVFTSGIANLPDLAKKFLFQVRFQWDNATIKALIGAGNADAAVSDGDITESIILRAKTATIPAKEFTDMTTEYMGTKLNFPGKMNISGEMSITFDEFQDLVVTGIFHNWQNLIVKQGWSKDLSTTNDQYTGGSKTNYANQYMATIDIIMYDSTLQEKLPYVWRLYRCWPKNMSTVDLGMEDDGKVQRQVTFAYSAWELLYSNEA